VDVADRVEGGETVVSLEERPEPFDGWAFLTAQRRCPDQVDQQFASGLTVDGGRFYFRSRGGDRRRSVDRHPTTSESASTTPSAWSSSTINGGSKRRTVRPAGNARTP
jgi:hypothetical protein